MPTLDRCAISMLLAIGLLPGCSGDSNKTHYYRLLNSPVMLDTGTRDYQSSEPIRPLPDASELSYLAAMVQLGNRLYHDTRLSGDRTLSCASCHDISAGGDDGMRFSVGINNAVGDINAPTVLNSGFNFVQFWNGRAANLQEQAAGPVANPIEMGADWDEVVALLAREGDYDSAFAEVFGDDTISEHRITEAIAQFELVLITPSPFDRYLRGDTNAISAAAQQGYNLFKQHGCSSCHQGINVGGNLFQKFGAIEQYYNIESSVDQGRLLVTNDEGDLSVFKVPSLRNVEMTAPYFHNGLVNDLDIAIRIMGTAQLGIHLSDEDVSRIAEFLRSLTGERNLLDEVMATAGDTL